MTKYQYETVKVEVSADGVAHVQLNRPKKLNAFNDQWVKKKNSGEELSVVIELTYL